MVSPPTANPNTRSRSASTKASQTKSASSRDEPTDCATTNISASKCSPACCRRYDPPKSPTRFPEDPILSSATPSEPCWPPSVRRTRRNDIEAIPIRRGVALDCAHFRLPTNCGDAAADVDQSGSGLRTTTLLDLIEAL